MVIKNENLMALVLIFVIGLAVDVAHSKLVGYWKFDEEAGDIVYDHSDNGNNGTINSLDGVIAYDKGVIGSSMNFDGSGHVGIKSSESFNFGRGDFSITGWLTSNQPSPDYMVTKRATVASPLWAIGSTLDRVNQTFSFVGRAGDAHNEFVRFYGKTKIVNTGWHHVAAVRKDGIVSLYVDGIVEKSQLFPFSMDVAAPLQIGGWPDGSLVGLIDEVRIYNHALNDHDIAQLYL
ncbi:LamG domain-containing protein, partial [Planctomycetota bacterium]